MEKRASPPAQHSEADLALAPDRLDHTAKRGRGAISAEMSPRFDDLHRINLDDGWIRDDDDDTDRIATSVTIDHAKRAITYNQSPDLPFDRSINPYRGCEHGCIYCYARPSHAWLGLSPGLDFETRLFAKPDIAILLAKELRRKSYRPAPIMLGANTDPYQPIEREWRLTRQVLERLLITRHPVIITTKSYLVTRDLDVLTELARHNLVRVMVSVTTLNSRLSRQMEPRASAPHRRIHTIARLAEAHIPVGVMAAPMIPALNDHEIEAIVTRAAEAGASSAGYVMLRLPHEVKQLFSEWLDEHIPDRAEHVLNRVKEICGDSLYDPRFGTRFTGKGTHADLLRQRFMLVKRKLGLDQHNHRLDNSAFCPDPSEDQSSRLSMGLPGI